MKMIIDEIKPGMQLARDLLWKGVTLLKEGAVLSEAMIDTIKKRKVTSADIVNTNQGQSSFSPLSIENNNMPLDNEIFRRRKVIEDLFASVNPDDEQMCLLKYCLIQQIKEQNIE